jgi:uncharacterized membrane protein
LIGFLCPILWVSVFSGRSERVVLMNAVHSGIVILIGLVLTMLGAWFLAIEERSEKQQK